jgi:hypothetical protein
MSLIADGIIYITIRENNKQININTYISLYHLIIDLFYLLFE